MCIALDWLVGESHNKLREQGFDSLLEIHSCVIV